MTEPQETKLTFGQKCSYSVPQIAINVMSVMTAQWLTFFYLPAEDDTRPALVGAATFAALMLLGRIVDGVADPAIGFWSDRTRSRWGRRMPFIVIGTPALALSFLALWFPPDDSITVANEIYLGAGLAFYWLAFTVVVGPYYALLPEIAVSNHERVRLSSVMAVFVAIGTVGAVLIGPVQSAYPDGLVFLGFELKSGIQLFAIGASAVVLVSFAVMPFGIREAAGERPVSPLGLVASSGSWLGLDSSSRPDSSLCRSACSSPTLQSCSWSTSPSSASPRRAHWYSPTRSQPTWSTTTRR
jgi:Na+/melibiose symporter-like transporter